MKQCCIIIPIYKKRLSENEEVSVLRTYSVFEKDIYFIAPEGLDCTYYKKKFEGIKFEFFASSYFESTFSYSKLLLEAAFYRRFSEYEYMLIAQTDVMILGKKIDLEKFIELGYDYWGAPWYEGLKINRFPYSAMNHLPKFIGKPRMCYVGNGGLSLRKISSTIDVIEKHPICAALWYKGGNEDCFFSYFSSEDYKTAPIELAEQFSNESKMDINLQMGKIPFGVHAWEKFFLNDKNVILQFIK